MLVSLSTICLENGNASIKHVLDIMSTHVATPDLSRVSADRLLSFFPLGLATLRVASGDEDTQEDTDWQEEEASERDPTIAGAATED